MKRQVFPRKVYPPTDALLMAFFAYKGKASLQNGPGITKILAGFEPFTAYGALQPGLTIYPSSRSAVTKGLWGEPWNGF